VLGDLDLVRECRHRNQHRCRHTLPGHWQPGASGTPPAGSLLARLLAGSFKGDPDAEAKCALLAEVCGAAALGYATRLMQPRAVVLHGKTAENGKSQVLELARSTARPILLHTGDFSYTAPAMMADMVSSYPDVVFVLGHSGSLAFVRDAIEVAKAFANAYLETSGMTSPAMLRRAVDELGAERILFGSDYPFWHPAVERERIDSARLDPAASRLILGENARRLYGF